MKVHLQVAQLELTLTAREARDEGMKRVRDHAARVDPAWIARAVEHVRSYALTHETLRCELVRAEAESKGFTVPEGVDKRCWGNAMTAAGKKGYVFKTGLIEATDPNVHMNPVGNWKSLIFDPLLARAA